MKTVWKSLFASGCALLVALVSTMQYGSGAALEGVTLPEGLGEPEPVTIITMGEPGAEEAGLDEAEADRDGSGGEDGADPAQDGDEPGDGEDGAQGADGLPQEDPALATAPAMGPMVRPAAGRAKPVVYDIMDSSKVSQRSFSELDSVYVKIDFEFDVSDYSPPVAAGDTVTFTVSSTGNKLELVSASGIKVANLSSSSEDTIGTAKVDGGANTVTVTFNGDLNPNQNLTKISGVLYVSARFNNLTFTPQDTDAFDVNFAHEWTLDGNGKGRNNDGSADITVHKKTSGTTGGVRRSLYTYGELVGNDTIQWYVLVNFTENNIQEGVLKNTLEGPDGLHTNHELTAFPADLEIRELIGLTIYGENDRYYKYTDSKIVYPAGSGRWANSVKVHDNKNFEIDLGNIGTAPYLVTYKTKIIDFIQDNQFYNHATMDGVKVSGTEFDGDYAWYWNSVIYGATAAADPRYSSKLIVEKVDEAAPNDPLPGAVFELYEYDIATSQRGSLVTTLTTDASGEAKVSGLESDGEFLLVEVSAPPGYVLGTNSYPIGAIGQNNTETKRVTNKKASSPGKLLIYKCDGGDASHTLHVARATFMLFSDEACTQPVADVDGKYSWKTEGGGRVLTGEIEAGTYYLKEMVAPPGFLLNDPNSPTKVTIRKDQTTEVHVANPRDCFELTIVKEDMEGKRLTGASFVVYRQSEFSGANIEVERFTVDSEDGFTYPQAIIGKYELVETKAPTDYAPWLDDLSFEITEEHKDQGRFTYRVQNQPIAGKAQVKLVSHREGDRSAGIPGARYQMEEWNNVTQTWEARGNSIPTGPDGLTSGILLEAGTYRAVQESAPPGYEPAAATVLEIPITYKDMEQEIVRTEYFPYRARPGGSGGGNGSTSGGGDSTGGSWPLTDAEIAGPGSPPAGVGEPDPLYTLEGDDPLGQLNMADPDFVNPDMGGFGSPLFRAMFLLAVGMTATGAVMTVRSARRER